ncbi:hypothetical protein GUITHDRAFT_132610 [Guillardia theta CCMP2712]|uniref:Uncharacterized protein n=1 Tax=Guillardia theta (strain CCMP2712) TaxID=905079 RepID=L1K189_GUITC|nr:hypothetical protein GUITHDRAFT_132610 [Guillardia theta CCMP2712]EKX54220.1 hypothetical protein GUITHDRAFT_132610 [Guillardia theta CCMP2712]|eukprot:XP_005841200.1 hypothetical protein GUITHDRAFT_132610 [Guillardia theta CCMP2712]
MAKLELSPVPGATEHNGILSSFHASLATVALERVGLCGFEIWRQDEAFLELLQEKSDGKLLVLLGEVRDHEEKNVDWMSMREDLFGEPVPISFIDKLMKDLSRETFLSFLVRIKDLLTECLLVLRDSRACRKLDSHSDKNFEAILCLKLLNVFVCMGANKEDAIINQWLWEGGVSTVLSKFLTRFKRFRHCVSLDATALLISTGLHNLSYNTSITVPMMQLKQILTQAGGKLVGDGIDDSPSVMAWMETMSVIGDISSHNMLMSRYRKTNLVEGILLWSSVVHTDAKEVGDLLSDKGVLNGGQLCYSSAFTLLFYYISTRHRLVMVEAMKSDAAAEQRGGAAEGSIRDEDGLPLVVGTCLTYLSLLLHSPEGEASLHCHVLLRSLVVLCEEAEFVACWSRSAKSTHRMFSTDKDLDPSKGYKEVNNLTAMGVMSQIVLKFMSNNMKLALDAAQLISFLVVFGLTLLPGEELYPHLCYEVARVGANKVFNKLLTSCTRDGMECQLQQVSFTDAQILQVVANAHLSLSLPLRQDLITFENFIEGEDELSLVKGRLALFVHRYARHIQILPSVFAGSEELDRS